MSQNSYKSPANYLSLMKQPNGHNGIPAYEMTECPQWNAPGHIKKDCAPTQSSKITVISFYSSLSKYRITLHGVPTATQLAGMEAL